MTGNYGRDKSISTAKNVSGDIINVNTHLLHPWGDIKIVSLASPDWRQRQTLKEKTILITLILRQVFYRLMITPTCSSSRL